MAKVVSRVSAKAPSSTANLGPGFDVFGLAIDAFYDEVTLTRTTDWRQGGAGTVAVGFSAPTKATKHVSRPLGSPTLYTAGSWPAAAEVVDRNIPMNPNENTAGLVVKNMRKEFGIRAGVWVDISKGVPPGYGMGSSGASAAAAAKAFDRLFDLGLDRDALVRFAGSGERASAGSAHYDNVAASVAGGFVVVRTDPLKIIRITPPRDLRMCVAVPDVRVPQKKTKVSRAVVPKRVPMADSVLNLANASAIVAGFMSRDPVMIGESVRDVIVEPARKRMIPGFDAVKDKALRAGALGVTISGAGPSVIAFATAESDMQGIARAMSGGFASAGIESRTILCGPAWGASITRSR